MLWLIWLKQRQLQGSQMQNSKNEEGAHYHEITQESVKILFSPCRGKAAEWSTAVFEQGEYDF